MNDLSTSIVPPSRELALLVETGLITSETHRALTVATDNLAKLKISATPVGQRHFNKIDTRLTVRNGTPVSRARDCLTGLANAWEGVNEDFHRFRELHFQAKLRRAKIVKLQRQIAECTDDVDRLIMEAEYALEMASIEKIESEVARGGAALKLAITQATKHSEQYQVILKQAGKEAFTEVDFHNDEVDYFLKSALWHASQTFEVHDHRGKWDRTRSTGPPESAAEEEAQRFEAQKNSGASLHEDVLLYFEGLGISRNEILTEIRGLWAMREAFEIANGSQRQPFTAHFDGWLKRTSQKYKERTLAAIGQHGIDRLKRIASIIEPTNDDVGDDGDVSKVKRRSMFK